MSGNIYDYIFSNILITLVILWFIVQVIVDRLEYIIYQKYMNTPQIVQGEIKELCRAALQGKRMSHYSGFHYAVVEYQYEGVTCSAKILRTKKDYTSRKVMLAMDQDNRNIVVRAERERAYKYPIHYFLLLFVPINMLYYSNNECDMKIWMWTIASAVIFIIMYYYRKNVIAHIYENRQQEWINKSVIKSNGEIPKVVTGTVFLLCILCIIFLMFYLPNIY